MTCSTRNKQITKKITNVIKGKVEMDCQGIHHGDRPSKQKRFDTGLGNFCSSKLANFFLSISLKGEKLSCQNRKNEFTTF